MNKKTYNLSITSVNEPGAPESTEQSTNIRTNNPGDIISLLRKFDELEVDSAAPPAGSMPPPAVSMPPPASTPCGAAMEEEEVREEEGELANAPRTRTLRDLLDLVNTGHTHSAPRRITNNQGDNPLTTENTLEAQLMREWRETKLGAISQGFNQKLALRAIAKGNTEYVDGMNRFAIESKDGQVHVFPIVENQILRTVPLLVVEEGFEQVDESMVDNPDELYQKYMNNGALSTKKGRKFQKEAEYYAKHMGKEAVKYFWVLRAHYDMSEGQAQVLTAKRYGEGFSGQGISEASFKQRMKTLGRKLNPFLPLELEKYADSERDYGRYVKSTNALKDRYVKKHGTTKNDWGDEEFTHLTKTPADAYFGHAKRLDRLARGEKPFQSDEGIDEGILGDRGFNRVMPFVKQLASENNGFERDDFGVKLYDLLAEKYGDEFAQSELDDVEVYWGEYLDLTGRQDDMTEEKNEWDDPRDRFDNNELAGDDDDPAIRRKWKQRHQSSIHPSPYDIDRPKHDEDEGKMAEDWITPPQDRGRPAHLRKQEYEKGLPKDHVSKKFRDAGNPDIPAAQRKVRPEDEPNEISEMVQRLKVVTDRSKK